MGGNQSAWTQEGEFHGHHRKGRDLNFKNMSLSNFSVANSTSYEALKSDVPRVAFPAETS
ncbi:hypothetical protein NQ318_005423 [Aromia moschata]|uniref:Uncharacterized protein n=1 Tax=Aromia moschata TaxID=1265417 RepID=A0AAV8YYL8_9CUCU|nr:hypothetical protein NQ318_005423 [Aromia moschata]